MIAKTIYRPFSAMPSSFMFGDSIEERPQMHGLQVRSLTLDKWDQESVKLMMSIGNGILSPPTLQCRQARRVG